MFNWTAVAFRLKAQVDEANDQLSDFVKRFYLRGYVVHKELLSGADAQELESVVISLEEEYKTRDSAPSAPPQVNAAYGSTDDCSDDEEDTSPDFQRPPGDLFVKSNENRRHVLLTPAAANRLVASMLASEDLTDLLRTHLGSRVRIVEAAAISVFCGAKHQAWHWDNEYAPEYAKIVTVFCAVQNTTPSMGPIEMIYYDGKWHRETVGTIDAGGAVVMESTTIHRGSKHTEGPPRRVAYASFMSLRGSPPDGPVYAIRDDMRNTEIDLNEREQVEIFAESNF